MVLEGQVEIAVGDEDPVTIDANHYLLGASGEPATLSDDGVTPNFNGVCKVTADTNLNIRHFASEESRRLGGVSEGQVMWVRAATEGRLWLQVYFQTDPNDVTAHNFGWIYGPAGTWERAKLVKPSHWRPKPKNPPDNPLLPQAWRRPGIARPACCV